MADAQRPPAVAVIGGYFTANMGGAGMTMAVVEHARLQGHRSAVLTLYPHGDAPHAPADVSLVPWTPREILLSTPLALLAALARTVGLPMNPFLRTAGLRALAQARVVVDVAGISFSDGRGLPILLYNTLMTGLPLLLGTPVVKAAQALGPFDRPLNRGLARLVLPRLRTVVARGDRTAEHLDSLGLDNVVRAADIAFAMPLTADAVTAARDAVASLTGGEPFVAVVPSSVVRSYCDSRGIDYVREMGALVRAIDQRLGLPVVVVPHSRHPSGREGRMHDLTICREVVAASGGTGRLLEPWLGPDGLRAAIGAARIAVTSRFHAMVSALATSTPPLVVGWSHKYAEVLRDFGLADWAVDYSELDADHMMAMVEGLLAHESEARESIEQHLPAVRANAEHNFDVIDGLLAGDTRRSRRSS